MTKASWNLPCGSHFMQQVMLLLIILDYFSVIVCVLLILLSADDHIVARPAVDSWSVHRLTP